MRPPEGPATGAPASAPGTALPGPLRDRIMAALDTVMDPELDESVAEMGFVESLAAEDGRIEVVFRLPTYWCSANFAFLMATDMRCALERLPEVQSARIRLVDHFASRRINRGVAEGQGFAAVFAGEATTDLAEIRRAFRERAFLGRQERLLRALAAARGVEAALAATVGDLPGLADADDPEVATAALRYAALRRHEPGGEDPVAPAFITAAGLPVRPEEYVTHLRALKRVRGAAEANAEMCRLYLGARVSHPAPGCEPENREDDDD